MTTLLEEKEFILAPTLFAHDDALDSDDAGDGDDFDSDEAGDEEEFDGDDFGDEEEFEE